MTATFTVSSVVGLLVDTVASNTLDIGIINTESDTINTGFETISIAMTTSDEVIGMNVMGQTRTMNISGKKIGTFAQLLEFSTNLKKIADYQLTNNNDIVFTYINTNSKLPYVSTTGLKCMIKDITIRDSNMNSPGELRYTLNIGETKGLG